MLHLGRTARLVRKQKGFTLRAAAEKLGITHVHLINVELNRTAPSMGLLDRFREVYEVDLTVLAWCLFGDPERLPKSVRGPMKALAEAWRKELGGIVIDPESGKCD